MGLSGVILMNIGIIHKHINENFKFSHRRPKRNANLITILSLVRCASRNSHGDLGLEYFRIIGYWQIQSATEQIHIATFISVMSISYAFVGVFQSTIGRGIKMLNLSHSAGDHPKINYFRNAKQSLIFRETKQIIQITFHPYWLPIMCMSPATD